MSELSYAVRRFVPSNLGWFYETRFTVGEAGRERGININAPIFYEWFPDLPLTEKRVFIRCRYFSGVTDISNPIIVVENVRPIALQGGRKNRRLVGEAIKGEFYGTIREKDLMIMVFEKSTKTLSWLCIRGPEGEPYRPIPPLEEEIYYNILNLLGSDTGNMWTPTVPQVIEIIQEVKRLKPHAGDLLLEMQLLSDEWNAIPYTTQQELAKIYTPEYLENTDNNEINRKNPLGEYSPFKGDRRLRVMREIKARQGQGKFRKDLRDLYGDQCMVTGCNLMEIVEAAHISPYRGNEDNHPSNGILLRADLHSLFDIDLLGIHPKSLEVHIHPRVSAAGYQHLQERILICPNPPRPSIEALKERWLLFQMRLTPN